MTNQEKYATEEARVRAFRKWDQTEGIPLKDSHARFERLRLWLESGENDKDIVKKEMLLRLARELYEQDMNRLAEEDPEYEKERPEFGDRWIKAKFAELIRIQDK